MPVSLPSAAILPGEGGHHRHARAFGSGRLRGTTPHVSPSVVVALPRSAIRTVICVVGLTLRAV
jgi:hypothetical protein